MDEEIKTYSPEVEEQKPLPVQGDTNGFEDVLESDGMISTKLNEKVIIQRIAKDLYKNATSGLRELYNNSARACRIAVKKHGEKKPLIRVSMNEEDRKLIITDNGLGLSKERFKKVLIELGTSDNLEAGEVGQFGMGFASYMTLSSVVTIDTRSRNGDQYKMIAKDGMSFQPIGDAELEGYGTKLTMTCYESVNFEELADKLVKIAKYSGIPTILELNGLEYYPQGLERGANALRQYSFDKEVLRSKKENTDIVEIENDDYHLIALAGAVVHSNYDDHIHLLNVPIESNIELPFAWWVLNIKDERKFKPMPDRDRMTQLADKQLEGLLDNAIKNYFSDLRIANYKEFLKSDRRNEFLWLVQHQDYAPTLLKPTLSGIYNCNVRKVVYDVKHFDDSSLLYKLGDNPKIIYQGYKNRGVTEKIRELEPDCLLITTKKTKKNHWKEHVKFMEDFGIPFARQIMLDHKIPIPKQDKAEFEIVGHTNEKYYEHDIVDLDDIDENVIRVDTVPMVDMIRYVKKFQNPYIFVRNAPELDEYDCRDYSEWLHEIPNIVCPTNKGAKTIKELAEAEEDVIFCTDFQEGFGYFFKEEPRIIVYGSNQLLPMALHLNPECAVTGTFQDLPNPVQACEFHNFVEAKYDVTLNSDESKKFFCNHMHEIAPCFHTLLGNLLKQTSWSGKDEDREELWTSFLNMIKRFEPFDGGDELAKLRFYYGENAKIADRDSDLGGVLEGLLHHTKNKIFGNEYLKVRLMKEMILPKIFGHIEFRKMVKQELSYQTCYDISIATKDTEFEFRDDLKVYDFDLMFRGCKMKINKGYCSIKVTVFITQ